MPEHCGRSLSLCLSLPRARSCSMTFGSLSVCVSASLRRLITSQLVHPAEHRLHLSARTLISLSAPAAPANRLCTLLDFRLPLRGTLTIFQLPEPVSSRCFLSCPTNSRSILHSSYCHVRHLGHNWRTGHPTTAGCVHEDRRPWARSYCSGRGSAECSSWFPSSSHCHGNVQNPEILLIPIIPAGRHSKRSTDLWRRAVCGLQWRDLQPSVSQGT